MNQQHPDVSPPDNKPTVRSLPVAPSPSPTPVDRSGQLLGGRYRLQALLGKTHATCDFYAAEDLLQQTPCTIKLGRSGSEATPPRDFRREVEIAARLGHPGIAAIRVLSHDEQGSPFLVLEALTGRSLDRLLAEHGLFGLPRVLTIVRAIGAALQHAHELGVVHGSLGLSSVFLHKESAPPNGTPAREVIKLLDFEQARVLGQIAAPGATAAATAVAAAPSPGESIEGAAADEFSDQCALGIIAYRLLSGRRPFAYEKPTARGVPGSGRVAEPLGNLVPRLPPYVAQAIHTALAKDPAKQHPSVAGFLQALAEPALPDLSLALLGDKTVEGLRADLIAICRHADAAPQAIPLVVQDEQPTRRYPTSSFADKILTTPPDRLPSKPPVTDELRPRQRYAVLCLWALILGLGAAFSAPVRRLLKPLPPATVVKVQKPRPDPPPATAGDSSDLSAAAELSMMCL